MMAYSLSTMALAMVDLTVSIVLQRACFFNENDNNIICKRDIETRRLIIYWSVNMLVVCYFSWEYLCTLQIHD
jgi:hypothetical protein